MGVSIVKSCINTCFLTFRVEMSYLINLKQLKIFYSIKHNLFCSEYINNYIINFIEKTFLRWKMKNDCYSNNFDIIT